MAAAVQAVEWRRRIPLVDSPHSFGYSACLMIAVIVNLTRCSISDPVAEAIANGTRRGITSASPSRQNNPHSGSESRISRRNIGVVERDETDFCSMIADVVAQPF
jgi:hypothetical protein